MPIAALALATAVSAAGGDVAAARVGDDTVTVADVDRQCGEKCARLVAGIAAEQQRTLELLIDEALLAAAPAPTPAAKPVSDDDVERYRIAHATELTGDEARDRAAVRFLLERDERAARDRALIAAARRHSPPRRDGTGGASVGTARITARDVEQRAALALYRLRAELARERLRQLAAAIDERLWEVAARAQGITPDDLRAQAAASAPRVTETDVHRYFVDEVKAKDPTAVESPERIRPYLEFRNRRAAEEAALAEIRRATSVEILIAEPTPPRFALAGLPGALSGRPGAPVQLVYLTSLRGAASRLLWESLRAWGDAGDPDVSLAVRPLLPQWDPDAMAVAAAIGCAAQQQRWWPILDTLSRANPLPDAHAILKVARAAGLDERRFADCVSGPETPAAIVSASREAERLGLVEPPIVLVNGLALGAPSADRLAAAVARARVEAAKGAPISAPSSRASASP